jgi:mannose-6-phosphate isomerase
MIVELSSNRVYRTYLGGSRIDRLMGKSDAKDGHFPEEWVGSTILAFNPGREKLVEGLSRSKTGELLLEIIRRDPVRLLGKEMVGKYGETLSILVKLLDSAERLVIQAHPTAEFASRYFHSQFGKTESWYILEADESACVYLGFKSGITRKQWMDCFEKQDIPRMLSLLHRISVKPNDCLFVDGGVPHAIGGGCLLLELQEPTDFMVVPERKTPSGNIVPEAKLHGGLGFDRMFDCFIYNGYEYREFLKKYKAEPVEICTGVWSVIDKRLTDKFSLLVCKPASSVTVNLHNRYAIVVIVEGSGEILSGNGRLPLSPGTQLFIGADEGFFVIHKESDVMKVIVCRP